MTPHIKHVIWAIVAVLAFSFGLSAYWKKVAHDDNVAHDQRVIAEEQLKQDKQAQTEAEAQAARDKAQYDHDHAIWEAQNAQLKALAAAATAALAARQEQDRALPPQEQATRWEALIDANPGSIQATQTGYLATFQAGTETLARLEEVPADQETIKSQSLIMGNNAKEISSLQVLNASMITSLDACKKAQVSADTACNARLKEQAAKAKKHGLIYNLLSFAAGVVLGHRF